MIRTKTEQLTSAAQDLTTSWADLGSEFCGNGVKRVGWFGEIDINDSNDVRVRLVAATPYETDTYIVPATHSLYGATATSVAYYEITSDANQDIFLCWDTNDMFDKLKFQVQVGTKGTTAGQIDESYYKLSYMEG